MTDWADEIAMKIGFEAFTHSKTEGGGCQLKFDRPAIASALRKAKADGMRDAAELLSNWPAVNHVIGDNILVLKARADAIEKGEP